MGLFDRIFGRGATQATQQPNSDQRFNELRDKYRTALNMADQQNIRFHNMYVQDNQLFIRGVSPSQEAKDRFWEQLKLVNPNFDDINADVTVEETQAQGATVGGGGQGSQTYTVKAGDTLSKISRQFYNDTDEYMRIFYANRDKLNDPDKIQVGQQLVIPPDDNA